MTKRLKKQMVKDQGGLCGYCGIEIGFNDATKAQATLDHVIPKRAFRQEGLTEKAMNMEENLLMCCVGCNAEKADLPLSVFMAKKLQERMKNYIRMVNEARL